MTDANVCGGGCKRLRERLQTFAGAVANVCGNGCNALRLRWAKLAPKSPVLVWIREFLQPSLHVLATFPARTCDLPCTYLREKSCWRGICELDFCSPPPSYHHMPRICWVGTSCPFRVKTVMQPYLRNGITSVIMLRAGMQ